MAKKIDIQQMLITHRIKLSWIQKINHFSIVLFFFFIAVFTLIDKNHRIDIIEFSGVHISFNVLFAAACMIIGVLFIFIQWQRLRLQEFAVHCTEQQFNSAIKVMQEKFDWQIKKKAGGYVRAILNDWLILWGEMITVIHHQDKIYINCISHPELMSGALIFGRNKKIIKNFIAQLDNIIQNKQSPSEKAVSEWSVKRIIIRFISYPFCIFLIGMGIYMIIHPFNWKSQGTGVIVAIAAIIYLYADVKIIFRGKVR